MLFGPEAGIGIGFFAGLLQDLAAANILGLNLIGKMAVGYLFGLLEKKVFKENLFVPALAVFFATIINDAISFLFLAAIGYRLELSRAWLTGIGMSAAYNMIVAGPFYYLVLRVLARGR